MRTFRLFFFAAISTLSVACSQDYHADVSDFINQWYEPVYNEVKLGDEIQKYYNGYVCLVIQDDGLSYLKSPEYEVEGPYSWCINEDGSLNIAGYTTIVEEINGEEIHLNIETGMVPINGPFIPCYSDQIPEGEIYDGDTSEFSCPSE